MKNFITHIVSFGENCSNYISLISLSRNQGRNKGSAETPAKKARPNTAVDIPVLSKLPEHIKKKSS